MNKEHMKVAEARIMEEKVQKRIKRIEKLTKKALDRLDEPKPSFFLGIPMT